MADLEKGGDAPVTGRPADVLLVAEAHHELGCPQKEAFNPRTPIRDRWIQAERRPNASASRLAPVRRRSS
jgi:hypothetical protein